MYILYILLLELMIMKNKMSINLNEPSFYILLALSKEPMSGYELTRDILNIIKGRLEVRTGTMYPTLKKLLDLKLIEQVDESSQERNKKIYQLTDKGKKILQHEVDMLKEDGTRAIRTLYKFNVIDNAVVDGKLKIIGEYEKVNDISTSLEKRLLENGMPSSLLEGFKGGGDHE